MEEFSPEHYNVLMSFKEWASGLYGSVGNAFKNFDKEGDGALTLSILRRACQKGKWSGDPQLLFDSVGPSGPVRDNKLKQMPFSHRKFNKRCFAMPSKTLCQKQQSADWSHG